MKEWAAFLMGYHGDIDTKVLDGTGLDKEFRGVYFLVSVKFNNAKA